MDVSHFTTWGRYPGETYAESCENNFKEVDLAEELEWDIFWAAAIPNPFVLCASIAARTKRIKLGPCVHLMNNLKAPGESFLSEPELGGQTIVRVGTVGQGRKYQFDNFPSVDPVLTAISIAMVDHLSHGRFIYGAGGDTAGSKARQDHFFEFLDVMKSIWTAEAEFQGYDGEYYKFPKPPTNININPKPLQTPYPPILLPIDSQQSFEPMGKMGYRVAIRGNIDNQRGTNYGEGGDAVLRDDLERYRKAWKEAGHPGNPGVGIRILTNVAATKEESLRNTETFRKARVERAAGAGRETSDASFGRCFLFGTPEEVVDRIKELEEFFGLDELLMEANVGPQFPRETIHQSMRLFTDKVMPHIK